jgi:zinc protease
MTPTMAQGLSPVREALPNGAVVIVRSTAAAPAVTINATLLAGGLYEPADLPGLAYLAAKSLDRGTERRDAALVAAQLDDLGIALKATASRHTFTVSVTCLSEDFSAVLELVADVIRRPTFPQAEVEKRRAEVITAVRQDDDNPAVRAGDEVLELLYGGGHPYGRRRKGTVESLDRIGREALASFHSRYFRPSVLSLVVVGDVTSGQVFERAAAEFGDWAGAPAGAVVVPAPPAASARRYRAIGMPGKSQADVAYGFNTISRLDPRYHAYWIMNNVLGQFGLGGRLADNIRERQGMAYYAFSSFDATIGEGPLLVRAGVDPGDVERALDAIDTEVRALGEEGPTATEFDQSRDFLIGSIPRMFETNASTAEFLQVAELFGLGLDYDRRLPELIRAVSIDDVRAAAADVLRPERAAVAVAGPVVDPS